MVAAKIGLKIHVMWNKFMEKNVSGNESSVGFGAPFFRSSHASNGYQLSDII